jgi:hypothetical protein
MKSGNWVYVQSEPGVYTVGFYSPDGAWHSETDHSSKAMAADRVNFLNGGPGSALLAEFISAARKVLRRNCTDEDHRAADRLLHKLEGR